MSFPPIMTIAHEGGEFLSVNISGLKKNFEAIAKILYETETLIVKPSTCRNIGLHIYDTKLSSDSAAFIVNWISKVATNIHKIAIIGLSPKSKYLFKKVAKKRLAHIDLVLIFSINKAKDWLVGYTNRK